MELSGHHFDRGNDDIAALDDFLKVQDADKEGSVCFMTAELCVCKCRRKLR